MTTRRELMIAGAALVASVATRRAGAAATGFSDQDFRRAIVIDGLGGFDDPYSPPEATVLDPRAVADLARHILQRVGKPGNLDRRRFHQWLVQRAALTCSA